MKNLKKYFILLICLSFFSCEKKEPSINNINGNTILALGHAGMGIGNTYPMNSLESLLCSLNNGADGTEMDVQMTKDGILVAFHDEELADNTQLSGVVNDLNWDELKEAYYTQSPYTHYPLISLEQFFSAISSPLSYTYTFDCKLHSRQNDQSAYKTKFIQAIIAFTTKYNLAEHLYVESQNEEFLRLYKSTDPSCKLFIYPNDFESGLKTALDLNLYGISISNEKVSAEQVKQAHEQHLFIALWNVHRRSQNKEAIEKNPDSIQSDDLKSLLKLLGK